MVWYGEEVVLLGFFFWPVFSRLQAGIFLMESGKDVGNTKWWDLLQCPIALMEF